MLDVRLTILRDRRGQQSGYMLVARDVSEQWRTQQALAESEAMLREERRLFIGGPTVIFRWEARRDWPVSYVSPMFRSSLDMRRKISLRTDSAIPR